MSNITKDYYNRKAQGYKENHSFENWPDKAEKQHKQKIDKFLEKLNFDKVLQAEIQNTWPNKDSKSPE